MRLIKNTEHVQAVVAGLAPMAWSQEPNGVWARTWTRYRCCGWLNGNILPGLPSAQHQPSGRLENPISTVCHLIPMLFCEWLKDVTQRDQLIRTFIMDGNFSAEHMRYKSGQRDIALSAGMAFMANPDAYGAHIRTGVEINQVRHHWYLHAPSLYCYRPVHAIPIEPLNRQIQVGRILTSQASEQLLVAMDSLFHCRWSISRRERGM